MTYETANKHEAGDILVKIKHRHVSDEQMDYMKNIRDVV